MIALRDGETGAGPAGIFFEEMVRVEVRLPILDLTRAFKDIREEVQAAVDRVFDAQSFILGREVRAFEEHVESYLGLPEGAAVGCASGSDALLLALMALGVGPGDEVVTTPYTFFATASAVTRLGATPVFADIDLSTYTLAPASVQEAITPRTRAIMPVHLYGHPASMDQILAIAEANGLMVFEDAAQAHGASLHGRRVGSFGKFGAFSFYPTKNMTCGEGGMVTTSDPGVERRVRLLRNQGMERRYANEVVGLNNRMTDISAAIGRVQLRKTADWTRRRQANAAFLDAELRGVVTPHVAPGAVHVYHQYTIRVEDRDRFAAALAEEYGVGSGVYYPIPCHRLESLSRFAPARALGDTDEAARSVLSLPVHPSLLTRDLERVVTGVNALARAGS